MELFFVNHQHHSQKIDIINFTVLTNFKNNVAVLSSYINCQTKKTNNIIGYKYKLSN